MSEVYEKLLRCYRSVRERIDFKPEIALILGSGLGDYADGIQVEAVLDYHEIEGFPVSTVQGHRGRFIFGFVRDVPVVVMQGRVHYYEGYSMSDVVLPTRLTGMLGARILFLTNASGGIQEGMRPGDLMLITDQISDFVPSPLIGPNPDELGIRFPDMSCIYREDLRDAVRRAAVRLDIPLKEGVYIQLTGPNYESPAEIRMCRALGADAVGMSTACEAIAANHMGMGVCGISCISNLAAGISKKPLSHAEVQESADRAAPLFRQLVTESILEMSEKLQG
ncbi:MAG: purine-nucleoside phosphorylase [Lachnospiraceae bacterium]|nr:purine-nucleoside phosphorylase [Lachnospiraceae bacterium]